MKKQTIKQNVETILGLDVQSRGDDKRLLLMYWKEIDEIDFNNFEDEFIRKGTMAESIRRQRQLLQEDGHFLPNDDVVEMRKDRQKQMCKSIREYRKVI